MAGGKVWLVGAGPGDAGLLTIRAKEVIEQADVIAYDALVGESILCTLPETAEKTICWKALRPSFCAAGRDESAASGLCACR